MSTKFLCTNQTGGLVMSITLFGLFTITHTHVHTRTQAHKHTGALRTNAQHVNCSATERRDNTITQARYSNTWARRHEDNVDFSTVRARKHAHRTRKAEKQSRVVAELVYETVSRLSADVRQTQQTTSLSALSKGFRRICVRVCW